MEHFIHIMDLDALLEAARVAYHNGTADGSNALRVAINNATQIIRNYTEGMDLAARVAERSKTPLVHLDLWRRYEKAWNRMERAELALKDILDKPAGEAYKIAREALRKRTDDTEQPVDPNAGGYSHDIQGPDGPASQGCDCPSCKLIRKARGKD